MRCKFASEPEESVTGAMYTRKMHRECSFLTDISTATGSASASDIDDSDESVVLQSTLQLKNTFLEFTNKRREAGRSSSAPPSVSLTESVLHHQRARSDVPTVDSCKLQETAGITSQIHTPGYGIAQWAQKETPLAMHLVYSLAPSQFPFTLELTVSQVPTLAVPCPPMPVIRLADLLALPEPGSKELPTVGSEGHRNGTCKPCAFRWKAEGCKNGVECAFCHLCCPGERRWRRKQRLASQAFRIVEY